MSKHRLRASIAGVALVATGLGACAPAPYPSTTVRLSSGSSCQVKATIYRTPKYFNTRIWVEKSGSNCGIAIGTGPTTVWWNKRVGYSGGSVGTFLKVRSRLSSTCQSVAVNAYGTPYVVNTRSCGPL